MRVAFDTNVLAYAEGFDDLDRRSQAEALVAAIARHELVLPVQVSAELTRLITRKFRRSMEEAAIIVGRWRRLCPIQPASADETFAAALALASEYRFQIFDALILAAAREARSDVLLSEDMQDGFVWRGVTVVNPFAEARHPLLADLMRH